MCSGDLWMQGHTCREGDLSSLPSCRLQLHGMCEREMTKLIGGQRRRREPSNGDGGNHLQSACSHVWICSFVYSFTGRFFGAQCRVADAPSSVVGQQRIHEQGYSALPDQVINLRSIACLRHSSTLITPAYRNTWAVHRVWNNTSPKTTHSYCLRGLGLSSHTSSHDKTRAAKGTRLPFINLAQPEPYTLGHIRTSLGSRQPD
ncbi:hypothetical protein BDY17DRAFT_192021 [Neohortaea acidophila]|uniref:Uncharacterized protein n=1 Tax=Neohortaea acidophila TaxID=245834 RepID=A0A6A6PMB0_9PEZI|nr:uncharacterized protein BDY17DRAFT_192021 [Neohortaea acidophila]KAF2480397.1 hypothetical protein BDY17DRAFT_192021 [Neohortaea acidophila]